MRALISVTDKKNIGMLAKGLSDFGVEIVSTGGTYKKIRECGIDAIEIEKITNFPEILDGRVKTLSPYVHGGILYKRNDQNHKNTVKKNNIKDIDIVVVNLYKFEEALKTNDSDNIIENIDIGGPTLIRSAAKNHKDVIILTDPNDYEEFLQRLNTQNFDIEYKRYLAMKAYSLTAYYDSVISRYFKDLSKKDCQYKTYGLRKIEDLRYGENPSQKAALYEDTYAKGLLKDIEILHGKSMSFNNYNDLNVALELSKELGENSCVALKHQSPCGVAIGEDVYDAYKKAYEADSLSIFGGIVVINGIIDEKTASKMSEIFLEIIAANDFTKEALEVLERKKNVRLIKVDLSKDTTTEDVKYLDGKVLVQDKDKKEDDFEVVTKKSPEKSCISDLKFAMTVVKYVKSNAIVIVKDGKTLGVGCGQTSRIWALESIKNNHPDVDFTDSIMSSDAFFPFDDCVEYAHKIGVKSIIQPGGSIRDKDSIDKCNEYGISMVFTNNRHFRH
ncbi:bifunctional phosphoribosylaminoimidazolecarboxamide formyltransferase/IMP cyclohydrolase [Anaerococcus sp. AGMB00486]|uniref:Bifunctional purine biosynthesis protein PurH n=1 Tax=Anaerococcus faecalis TaxID=2742993 RepID=A0ABX2N9M0_9FIRM|nr:bifunctional phosphoribosylaminoimidazolecarboxamide formyltransferase/IMP cyclohydrolase [Anaerococcus faecalis]NVF11381.1 bifunctional phosphoribosylaminoimidazolecarboxamide formyltransferase/IMP cyclohydrolase [Anaerococcus faecalis]